MRDMREHLTAWRAEGQPLLLSPKQEERLSEVGFISFIPVSITHLLTPTQNRCMPEQFGIQFLRKIFGQITEKLQTVSAILCNQGNFHSTASQMILKGITGQCKHPEYLKRNET